MNAYLPLIAAVTVFVGGHFLFSADPLRPFLVKTLGEKGFLAAYSLVALAGLAATVVCFRGVVGQPIWNLGGLGRHVAMALMPFAVMLVVLGVSSPNPTAQGNERFLEGAWQPSGIVTITRHPFLWGTGLWSICHLLANGNGAALILFGGMGILSFGGMFAIDGKRRRQYGQRWIRYAQGTSVLPFAGATPVDWRGIGWAKPMLALVVYACIVALHGWAFNRPLM